MVIDIKVSAPRSPGKFDFIGTRHKIVTFEKFLKKKKKLNLRQIHEAGSDRNYYVEGMTELSDRSVTDHVHDCAVSILRNDQRGSMGHFYPDSHNIGTSSIRDAFRKHAMALRDRDQPLSGAIYGGESDNPASRALHDTVERSFHEAGIARVSQIWGRKTGINTLVDINEDLGDFEREPNMKIIYDGKKKTNYIFIDGDSEILSPKGIAYWYEKFHLAPGDILEAQGKTYQAEEAHRLIDRYRGGFKPGEIVPTSVLNRVDEMWGRSSPIGAAGGQSRDGAAASGLHIRA